MSDDDQSNSPCTSPKHVDPSPPPPPSWEELKNRGNQLFQAKEYDRSIAEYTRAIEANPKEPSLYSNRSAAYLLCKRYAPAMEDAAKCLELDPMYVKGYGRYATAACNLGRFHDAVLMLQRGLVNCKSVPNSAVITAELQGNLSQAKQADDALTKARASLAEGNESAALRAVSPVVTLFPECFELAAVVSAARAPSAPTDALAALNGFSRTHGDVPEYHYARAYASYFNGANGMKNALLLLKQVLELDPDHAAAKALFKKCREAEKLKNLGTDAYKARDWEAAVTHYTAAANVDPKNKAFNSVLYGNRAAARMELKQFTAALGDVSLAIEGGQDAAKYYARRARIHEQLENWDEAQRDMKRAAELDEETHAPEVREMAKRAKLASRKDWYKVLGITRHATEQEIKKGYRLEAMKWHPDKWSAATDTERTHAEKKFKEVGEANAILSDPQKRRLYDNGQIDNETDHASGGASRGDPFGGGMGGMGGMSQEDLMAAFMMGGMGGMGGGPRRSRGGQGMGGFPGFSFGGM
jgi:DnaJ family protein C protein 7